MKKLVFLVSSASLSLTGSSYAFDIAGFLNQKLSSDYREEKTNMDSGCQLRNWFDGNKCVLFWTQFNEYIITRSNDISNEPFQQLQTAGTVTVPVTCQIVRHKLNGVTNPDSTDKSHKLPGDDTTSTANYNVKFDWYINSEGNPFSSYKQSFYINNNVVTSMFISGSRDVPAIADEYCTKGIVNAIRSLNGLSI